MNKTMTTRPTSQMILFTILSFGRAGLRTSQQRTAQVHDVTEMPFKVPCVSEQWVRLVSTTGGRSKSAKWWATVVRSKPRFLATAIEARLAAVLACVVLLDALRLASLY